MPEEWSFQAYSSLKLENIYYEVQFYILRVQASLPF